MLEFLGGGALALGAHESGHLLFDAIFDANAGLKKVSFHGIPFFAITHDTGLPPTKEFVIDSAGFWVQEATNEWLLTKRPRLRHEHAPLLKGMRDKKPLTLKGKLETVRPRGRGVATEF